MSERIGFIGLGNMGRGMAGQLVAKGFDTTVFDIAEAPMEILRQKGAKRAASIPALVAASDIVLTMLPNTPDVQGVVLGEGGLLAGGRPGMMHIDMSTIDPLASRAMAAELAARGIGWVDAGVGRSPAHAERGEVSFMVGATDADYARAKPLLEAMGTTIVHCGGPGAGISMKITLNFLSMATCQLTAETLALGTKLGLKMEDMHTIITSGLACNEHFRQYWPTKVLAGDTTPGFAIGQRALLILRPEGNILWDCITLLDAATIALVKSLGGISRIAISHPHYYSAMAEWAQAFGAEVWLHAADRAHVLRPDPALRFWSGPTHALAEGITLINAPGHYDGGAMLHWRDGAGGLGALLTGDIIQLLPDRAKVSFMRSYPNLIPLPARTVTEIEQAVAPFAFDRLYGAWWDKVMPSGGKQAIAASAERYRNWIAP